MLIAHISDLHCGLYAGFNSEALELAIEEINELMPDIVVITGDITHNGFLSDYKSAIEYIGKIKCERKIIGSGNHDYRSTGYLLCQRYFQRPPILEFENAVIIYLSTARPDKDEGEAGYRQIQWLGKTLSKHKDKFKVVALHHHLVPIPDTGLDRSTVTDAGDIIRTLTQGNVDLVLCGHRHRPWSLNLGNSQVINAGTVSSERFRGFFANSYNIVRVENNKINVKLKVVGGKTMDFKELLTERKPFIP